MDKATKTAKLRVEAIVLNEWNRREPTAPKTTRKAEMFLWTSPSRRVGIRVAELSMVVLPDSGGMSGCSFMQSDTEAVPFLIERLMLEMTDCGEDLDLYEDRLIEAIFGK